MITYDWSDKELEGMRQFADLWGQRLIIPILDPTALESLEGKPEAWLREEDQAMAALQAVMESAVPSAEAAAKMGSVYDQQSMLLSGLEVFGQYFWPPDLHFHLRNARTATLMACKALLQKQPEDTLAAMRYARANMATFQEDFARLLPRYQSDAAFQQSMVAGNRIGYNRYLRAIDQIRRWPELTLAANSYPMEQFDWYSKGLTQAYQPIDCPGWVDIQKLRRGVGVWQRQELLCLLVLFSHSLPACYLMQRGIPMLYQTERLTKQRFIAQRIYETAFMLHDVMSEGGLLVIEDLPAIRLTWLAAAVHTVKPDLSLHFGPFMEPVWTDPMGKSHSAADFEQDPQVRAAYQNLRQTRKMPEDFTPEELGISRLGSFYRFCLNVEPELAPVPGVPDNAYTYYRGRYLWGRGFLAAMKVRMFHASMRYYAMQGKPPYNTQENGQPINQEDLAYTLLTFGYLIPRSIEKWGGMLSREDKEAFLHCWRVVGHILGIYENLNVDDWDQARELFNKIKAQQQFQPGEKTESLPKAIKLLDALCIFFTDLLPGWLPFRGAVAPVLIREQLGPDADLIFSPENRARSKNLAVRAAWFAFRHTLLKVYFLSRFLLIDRIPYTLTLTNNIIEFLGRALVESWRQTFERQPLDLTQGETGFEDAPGIQHKENQRRESLRRKVCNWVLAAMGCLVLLHSCMWGLAASLLLWRVSRGTPWIETGQVLFWVLLGLSVICITAIPWIEQKVRGFLKELEVELK